MMICQNTAVLVNDNNVNDQFVYWNTATNSLQFTANKEPVMSFDDVYRVFLNLDNCTKIIQGLGRAVVSLTPDERRKAFQPVLPDLLRLMACAIGESPEEARALAAMSQSQTTA